MKILGIETSCDETAVAVVTDERAILSNLVASQIDQHRPYGGVVPEIAARAHISRLDSLITQALEEADTTLSDIDAIAATSGPGLIGGVLVGMMMAKGLASAAQKPFIAVNHLEGHALTARLVDDVDFPFLLLLVSGGHCQILVVENVGKYHRLGTTLDDALGEAFDKTAKMLGLGYPGGPAIEKRALQGNENRFDLPRPLLNREGCDFSFSGLKTAVHHTIEQCRRAEGNDPKLRPQEIDDVCASFQRTCGDILHNRLVNAVLMARSGWVGINTLVVAGGVAANQYLRERLTDVCDAEGLRLAVPPVRLCTDNAAMIAWAGVERFRLGLTDNLATPPRARWPLELLTSAA